MREKLLQIILLLILNRIKNIECVCAPPDSPAPCFSQSDFDIAFNQTATAYNITEATLISSYSTPGFLLEHDAAIYEHFRNKEINEFAIQQNRYTTIIIKTLQALKANRNYTKQQLRWCAQKITLPSILPKLALNCQPSNTSYYRLDGQCNSDSNPLYGSVYTPFVRLLEDGYEDGLQTLNSMRQADIPRNKSNIANAARGLNQNLSPETTSDMATMAFQILTHDMMSTMKTQLQSAAVGGGFDCCNSQTNPLVENLIKINDYCMPMSIPPKDPCYNESQCLNYIRSFRAFDQWNVSKAPSQVNFHTPFIDFELVYNQRTLDFIRTNKGFFPLDDNAKMKDLLVGFDSRSMQLPGLFLYLSYYIRLHNEIIKEFNRWRPNNPLDNTILETRKIVTAVFQKISIDLVQSVMEFQIPPSSCYDKSINPQVSLEFNIGFRVLHYFIRDKMGVYDARFFKVPSGLRGRLPRLIDQDLLIDNLTWYQDNKCGLMHGLADTSWNLGGLGDATRCRFFSKSDKKGSTDLRSMDFQFAREMGEPSYLNLLRFMGQLNKCDEDVVANDLKNSFDAGTLNFLAKRYQNKFSDLGLTFGMDLEARNGAILEPSVQFLIREQFTRTICGDRFWFNHDGGIFTPTQRSRIAAFDANTLLCVNHNCNDTRIQFFPFFSSGRSFNQKVFCFSTADILRILDIRTW